MAAATGRNDASITSSSSSAISALPLPAPLAPRPGSGSSPSVVSLPAKLVAPLPPRPLSSASVPARPSAANASQAPAPSAPRLPAPPIAALPSEAPRPPPAPVPGGDAATSSSLIDDIFRLPSSSAATAAAAATVAPSAASHAREPPRSPPVQAFQSAHDDGHDPSSCPCCPPRPPDLHLWTPQRLASVLLNERYRHGEEAFRNFAMDFRAYVQAFGCEALRIRAERMPWYRRRSPRAGTAAAAGASARASLPAATTTAGVVRPAPASAQVSTDPRKRPRLA